MSTVIMTFVWLIFPHWPYRVNVISYFGAVV